MDTPNPQHILSLPVFERAEAIAELMRLHNIDQKVVSKMLGIEDSKVSRFLMPVRFAKAVKDRLLALPVQERPTLGPIELLCRLPEERQQEFIDKLPRHLSEKKQVLWLASAIRTEGIVLSRGRYRNRHRLDHIENFSARLQAVSRKTNSIAGQLAVMSVTGRLEALGVMTHPTRIQYLRRSIATLSGALEDLTALLPTEADKEQMAPIVQVIGHMPRYPRPKKARPSRAQLKKSEPEASAPVVPPKPKVEIAISPSPPKPEPPVVERPVITRMPALPMVRMIPKAPPPVPALVPKPRVVRTVTKPWAPQVRPTSVFTQPTPVTTSLPDITVEYWNESGQRFVLDKISAVKYVALAKAGKLKYQQKGLPRPEHLPDPEEIEKKLKKL